MKNKNLKAILFDLDGTLMNTLEDLTDSTNYVLENNNCSKRNIKEIRSFVGNGIKKLMERALPCDCSEELINKCFEEMIIYYKEHSTIKTKPYEGVISLIEELHKKGFKIGVITNKAQNSADIIVNNFFGTNVDITIGDSKNFPLKPAPNGIFKAMNFLNVTKEETVYIGDSEVDIATARNSDLEVISVLWGFRDEDFLKENGGNIFAKNVEELKNIIFEN